MIGGNVTAQILKRTEGTKDARGIAQAEWPVAGTITGWMDLMAGDSHYQIKNAKALESTHIFLADWKLLPVTEQDGRFRLCGNDYDIQLIDDPMNLHGQLEIYLRLIGPAG